MGGSLHLRLIRHRLWFWLVFKYSHWYRLSIMGGPPRFPRNSDGNPDSPNDVVF